MEIGKVKFTTILTLFLNNTKNVWPFYFFYIWIFFILGDFSLVQGLGIFWYYTLQFNYFQIPCFCLITSKFLRYSCFCNGLSKMKLPYDHKRVTNLSLLCWPMVLVNFHIAYLVMNLSLCCRQVKKDWKGPSNHCSI